MTVDWSNNDATEAAEQGKPAGRALQRSGMKVELSVQGDPRPRQAKRRRAVLHCQPAAMTAPKSNEDRGQTVEEEELGKVATAGMRALPKTAGGAILVLRCATVSAMKSGRACQWCMRGQAAMQQGRGGLVSKRATEHQCCQA